MTNLGVLYENGNGVSLSFEKAGELYEKAADLGDANAIYNLGWLYTNGLGDPQSYEKAADLFERTADFGNADAMYILYAKGKGDSKSYEKAEELFRQAAENGKTDAMYVLGLSYENGSLGIVDQEKALEWYQKAADAGHEKAKDKVDSMK